MCVCIVFIVGCFRWKYNILPMQSSQLRNIQNIQNSLSLLRGKIEKMTKLDSHNQETMSRLILKTVPVVERKLKENLLKENMQNKKMQQMGHTSAIKHKNNESRMVNQKQVARSRQLLTLIKHHNSLHLKQSKKHNEERIKQLELVQLNSKKQKKQLVRLKEQEAQLKIQEFHRQKQLELKQRKEHQSQLKEEKIGKLLKKMRNLARQQIQLQEKVKHSQESIHKFKEIIQKVDRMKCDDFLKFKDQLAPSLKHTNSKSLSEAILQFAARQQQ